ncbi:hypothetical protein ACX1NB_01280 [Mycoplasma sp. HF14]
MEKVKFSNKRNTVKATGLNPEEIIRAEDINELKTVLNSTVDAIESLESSQQNYRQKVETLQSNITRLQEVTQSLKPKKTITKSKDCPNYKSEVNLYYLTDNDGDTVNAITITIKFKNGEEKCVTIIPTDGLKKFSFDVTGNDHDAAWVWYFEVRPYNTSSAKGWRDIYVKFMGAHSLFNGTWGTNPHNAIKEIVATSLFTPK